MKKIIFTLFVVLLCSTELSAQFTMGKRSTAPRARYDWNTIILGGISFSESFPTNYTVTFGQVKRVGYYLRAGSNMNFNKGEKYDWNGDIFWSGEGCDACISYSGGLLWRLSNTFILGTGIGKINNKFLNKALNGDYYETHSSRKSTAYELSLICSFGRFVLAPSASYDSDPDSFRGSISAGIMF